MARNIPDAPQYCGDCSKAIDYAKGYGQLPSGVRLCVPCGMVRHNETTKRTDLAGIFDGKGRVILTWAHDIREIPKGTKASQRGSVSLPLLTFQACAGIGLASGVVSVVTWAQGVLGGLL